MELGVFVKDPKTGVLTGSIRTLSTVVDPVHIVPEQRKRTEASPDYRVQGPTGSDFGAGWNKISNSGGKPYVSLLLHDPAFNDGKELNPILTNGEDGKWVMWWQAADASRAPSRPATTPAEASASDAPAPGKRAK